MTPQHKDTMKYIGYMITAGIFLIGIIFGAGQFVAARTGDHNILIEHTAKVNEHETRIQTLEKDAAVQEVDSKNMRESITRIEKNTDETKALIRELLKTRK